MTVVKYELLVNDQPVDESVYPSIVELQVAEDSDRAADSFMIRLSAIRDPSGKWSYPAEDKLQLFTKIQISASFPEGETEHLIEGYITNLEFHIDKEERMSYVDIFGMDSTLLMNLEENLVSWVEKSDSNIAREIFEKYGFEAIVEDTIDPPAEEEYTLIQRETDIEFLKRLAHRNGFECFVRKDYQTNKVIGYFRKPVLDLTAQKDLAVQFGEENNVVSIDFSVDGLRPLIVEMRQKDAFKGKVPEVKVEDSLLEKIGNQDLPQLIGPKLARIASGGNNGAKPRIVLSRTVVSEPQRMEAIARSVFDNGSWFITAHGVADAEAYTHLLRSKKPVLIKGAGDYFSGKYYVSKVTHRIKPESYLQEFEAKRNAIGVEGSEGFR